MTWKFVRNLAHPHHGHIEPLFDEEQELIADWMAEVIAEEVNKRDARIAELEDALDTLRKVAVLPMMTGAWLALPEHRLEEALKIAGKPSLRAKAHA